MKKGIYILSFLLSISFYSCKKEIKKEKSESNLMLVGTLESNEKTNSTFAIDTSLKAQEIDLILAYSDQKIDTLLGFCNCEKNVKKNTLKIQIRTEFPSLSELEKGNTHPTEFLLGVPRQYRFITFYLRDSIIDQAKLLMASTEPQFEHENIDSISIHNYTVKISRFNYKVAQNVWGTYEIELQNPLGYAKNDNKLKGTFHCNNWKIEEYEDLPNLTKQGEDYIE
ncbi:MAG: hypothetical protein WA951_12395 [Leeuwenhoekiella sp.]